MSESISAPVGDAALAAEFPGWTINVRPDGGAASWRATRDGDRGAPMTLGADSRAGLRALLDEVDAADSRQAAYDLCGALRARGVKAESQGVSVATQTRTGILRVVTARHGVYTWSVTGTEIGSTDDPSAAADRILSKLRQP